jgi:hypothetical protein
VLDEPEAFLHPPQARRLATALVDLKPPEAQLFVATHDSNFVRGLLDGSREDLSIVRVSRNGQKNPMHVIAPATLSSVAQDPVLRHSNIIDSIFHTAAVVCEAEADCLLYESVAVDCGLVPDGIAIQFTGSSGKQRVLRVCELLRELGVPVAAVVDFDILKSQEAVLARVQALGGDASSLKGLVASVASQLQSLAAESVRSRAEYEAEIERVFGDMEPNAQISNSKLGELSRLAASMGQWSHLKNNGASATRGQVHADVKKLLGELAGRRLHIVPDGELESWFRDAPGKGASHVAHVLDREWHTDLARNQALVKFVGEVIAGASSGG